MKLLLRGILLFTVVLMFSCKDDDSIIGENFIEENLEIKFDTITNLEIYSSPYNREDTVHSGAGISLIGDYHDDVFGDHKAISVFNLAPESNDADFGEGIIADSLVLRLDYKTFFGYDITNPLTITAYRVQGDLDDMHQTPLNSIDLSGYYDENSPLGSSTFLPDTSADTKYLKIHLGQALADEFVTNRDSIATDTAFISFFNGIVLKAERTGGTGSVISFNFAAEETQLTLHFQNETDVEQTFNYYADRSDLTKRYNFFEHNYIEGSIRNSLVSSNPLEFKTNDSLLFLQAMRGIDINIDVNLAGSEIAEIDNDFVINKAFLQFYTTGVEIDGSEAKYTPPNGLKIMEMQDGELLPVVDYYNPSSNLSNPSYYDGDNDRYEISLSRLTFQKLVDGEMDYSLLVQATQSSVSANRAIIHGTGSSNDAVRPRLVVMYSTNTKK
ncbi:MAG: DUF4270 family protein [Salinivirgaceae bacterium]|jgi:hypothetical protein|nr:DUF4270 family protein [Salinivirgaceae bacterium]